MNTHRALSGVGCRILVVVAVAFLLAAASAPAVVGNWNGALDAGPQGKLHIVVHITQAKDGSLAGTMDSTDQGANGIPITSIAYNAPTLHFECSSINGSYDGKMNQAHSEIDGTWSQGGASLPLNLTHAH